MKVLALLLFIPSLITADFLCPNSKTTCPEDKHCCEVDGKYSCCDSDDDQDLQEEIRLKVYPGVEMSSPNAYGNVSFSGNETIQQASFCGGYYCSGECCNGGCCEGVLSRCCGNGCCDSGKCCGNGCCGFLETCCPSGCCKLGYGTCCRSWCCKDGYRCGSRLKSCVSQGSTMYPEIAAFLLLAASVFVSRHL